MLSRWYYFTNLTVCLLWIIGSLPHCIISQCSSSISFALWRFAVVYSWSFALSWTIIYNKSQSVCVIILISLTLACWKNKIILSVSDCGLYDFFLYRLIWDVHWKLGCYVPIAKLNWRTVVFCTEMQISWCSFGTSVVSMKRNEKTTSNTLYRCTHLLPCAVLGQSLQKPFCMRHSVHDYRVEPSIS